ncbi:MAG TPA: hypothetical protein VGQ99_01105 [Tepidisphaeraceae bacterium]|jgi:hypothetical protein|nr:hypothetical protein [Tepidisphaeraceae bacterium]
MSRNEHSQQTYPASEGTIIMVESAQDWPDWWNWELDCSNSHLVKRMIDRSFNETDLREMLQKAYSFHEQIGTGRFIVDTVHASHKWRVVVEPNATALVLIVVTAYPLD